MKHAGLKIKTYAGSVSIVDSGNLEKRALSLILMSFGALAVFYMLILGNMVWNIIERKSLEANARVLLSETGELELNYLTLSSKIDPALGLSMGFKEAETKQFATRRSVGSLKLVKNEL